MDNNEFKLLLNLLSQPNHRGTPNQIKPVSSMNGAEVRLLCNRLAAQGYITLQETILKIQATDLGRERVQAIDPKKRVSRELRVLLKCKSEPIKPQDTGIKPAAQRDETIDSLCTQGLLLIVEQEITLVSLTEKGKNFLAHKSLPTGKGNLSLSAKLLSTYLKFLRNYLAQGKAELVLEKPQDQDILQAIITLDQQLNTDSYLPIFHLRDKYQSVLTREELDQALYRLESEDKISLSSLVDGSRFTKDQYEAGIPQVTGGPLFFLIVK